jgi:predicted CoA-substrate-specific enzyme activase
MPDPKSAIQNFKSKEFDVAVAGVDIGSRTIKAVIMEEGKIISSFINDSILQGAQAAVDTLSEALKLAGLKQQDLKQMVATGYGRFQFPGSEKHISEISCHARGVHWYNPEVRTILDIGGQDSKAINCDEKGRLTNFVLNSKCAGGTGRFLEVIADLLDVSIDELGELSQKSTKNISFSTVCVIFAKTEALNMLREGVEKSDIASGLHNSIATVTSTMLHKISLKKEFSLTGGVAKNIGVIEKIAKKTGMTPYICPQPQLVGAIGAALFAEARANKV